MGSRLKEDEKNERIIRGLLKQPANRKCINCNSLGPQYVCTTFWTFVCTNCSGIHREFTHRVKSVSMAKFTTQEVSSLQEGGNERAKEIYLKDYDTSHPLPESSNVNRLRDFIKHVYVDRRYTGERSSDKPPSLRTEAYDNRREDSYHTASRSPAYEDTHERRYSDKASPGYERGRSPGHDQDSQRQFDYGKSPAQSGTLNDWKREDRFAIDRKAKDDSKPEGTGIRKDTGVSSPPAVRPVREILGDSTVTLRVIEPPRESGGKVPGGTSQPKQMTASSSSSVSNTENPTELKKMDSLIDFDADPVPQATSTLIQPQQAASNQRVASSDGDNWACFDNAPGIKPSQTPANSNPLESMLTQLSVPVPGAPVPSEAVTPPAPSVNSLAPVNLVDSLFASTTPSPAPIGSPATLSPGTPYGTVPNNATLLSNYNASVTSGSAGGNLSTFASGWASTMTVDGGSGQFLNIQHPQQLLYPGLVQGASSNPGGLAPEANAMMPFAGVATQPDENISSGRKELPADLFTAVYSSYPQAAAQGWQAGFAPPMRPMQYNATMLNYLQPMPNQLQLVPNYLPVPNHLQPMPNNMQPMPNYMQPAKSPNPFNAGGAVHAARPTPMQFPSMVRLQGALPNMAAAPTGMGMGTAPPSWMPPQPSTYQSFAPQMTPSYGTTGTYMGQQQLPSNTPLSRNQGFGGTRTESAASFSYFNPAPPSNPNNHSVNPFG